MAEEHAVQEGDATPTTRSCNGGSVHPMCLCVGHGFPLALFVIDATGGSVTFGYVVWKEATVRGPLQAFAVLAHVCLCCTYLTQEKLQQVVEEGIVLEQSSRVENR